LTVWAPASLLGLPGLLVTALKWNTSTSVLGWVEGLEGELGGELGLIASSETGSRLYLFSFDFISSSTVALYFMFSSAEADVPFGYEFGYCM